LVETVGRWLHVDHYCVRGRLSSRVLRARLRKNRTQSSVQFARVASGRHHRLVAGDAVADR
jgi:hypothetical protein